MVKMSAASIVFTILFMTAFSFIGRGVDAAFLSRKPLENHHFTEPLLDRLGRCAAPARARRHVSVHDTDRRNLRTFTNRDVVVQSNARTQHNKVLKSGTA